MSAKEPELPVTHDHSAHDHGHDHDHPHDHAHDHDHSDHDDVAAAGTLPSFGYWRSLRELEGKAPIQTDPTTTSKEFATPPDRQIDPLHRRNFFQLMGASMALAGVGACRYEKEEIVPLARRPEGQVPGVTQHYATAFELGGVGYGLLATSFEGRPIKLDGNPEHPFASGGIVSGTKSHAGSSTFAQASVLNMYDPDRSQNPTSGGKGASMDTFRAALPELRKNPATTRVLSEATSSPTVQHLKRRLTALGVGWHEYESLSWDNEREGTRRAFNTPVRPIARLDRAETIVTIDCDLFIEHPAAMKYSRDYARSRKLHGSLGLGKMNRLWSVESAFTNTGAMADHRLGLRSELALPFVMALDAALGGGGAPAAEFLKEKKVAEFIKHLSDELRAGSGRSVLVAGRRQPPEVHAVVAKINQAIGAVGATLDYHVDPDPDRKPHLQSIKDLVADIQGGRVQTLIILGGNPVYDAPADLDFTAALAKVTTSVHLHEYVNETSRKTSWHVPRSHFLEAWGDTRTWDGTITVAQPLMAPLYGSVSAPEMLSMLLGEAKIGEELVKEAHAALGVTAPWRQSVHDGFVPNTQLPANTAQVTAFAPPALTQSQQGGSKRPQGDIEVTFSMSPFSYDGRYANNAWLQETPDFMTKVTWDNYALVGPETAEALNLENDTLIKVKVGDRELEIPCYTIPGQARYSVSLVLGGGRTAAGRVGGEGTRTVGFDTNKVRLTSGFDIALKATVTGTGKAFPLASVQEHWDIRTGLKPEVTQQGIAERLPELIREVTKKTIEDNKGWRAEGDSGYFVDLKNAGNTDRPNLGGQSLFKEKDYLGHRWGMVTDLTTCTGCNACVVACQAENNVPVVGKQEIFNNREMSWIRIDRYFSGTPDEPQVVHQPLACQHCEQAPCEQVCPVGATSHSDEGLNDMAYNRCIGTRYCANNCPYKVRRFNFLDWNKEWREARNKVRTLLFNPEVTVRMRGVMEKCTFCVQRIQNGKIRAKAQIRAGQRAGTVDGPIPDGEIQTACQEACPTEAIVFGDLADKTSRVAKLFEDNRSYDLLPVTYTKPRNRYLARMRNPNPHMPAPQGAAAGTEGAH
ncbi:MAG: molybdopterin oxidoreductase, iron-sulfur binding subunit [Myxococcales bacterium]|nr:molybdopterin oxidoreductase, iron-sulfur binding subunit [Myxococcales bacterium]